MRQVTVLDDVRIRFPGRGEEFDVGLELGIFATLMAIGELRIERTVSLVALEQLRPLAVRFNYAITAVIGASSADVSVFPIARRPRLSLVR